MPQNNSVKHPIFPNLNGLRTIGAFAVVLYHAVYLNRNAWGEFSHSFFFEKLKILVSRGHHAIELFFIISGFLITWLLLHEKETKGSIHFGNFLARRFLRVWPLYFLIVLFGFFVYPNLPFGIETSQSLLLFSLFLSNFSEIVHGANDAVNFLSVTWTVSVEEQFYLVWVVLFAFIRPEKKQTLIVFLIALIAGSLVFRAFHYDEARMLHVHTLSVMQDIAVGALAAVFAGTGKAQEFFARLSRLQICSVYIAFIALLVFEDHLFKGSGLILKRLVSDIFIVFIVLEQVFAPRSFFKADKIPGFYFSGKRTYGIYMYHCISIYYLGIVAQSFPPGGLTFFCYLIAVFVSTWITAFLSYRFFESPFLRLQSRFRD